MSIWLTVLNTDKYRNKYQFFARQSNGNYLKMRGNNRIRWIADNNASSQRKQLKNAKNIALLYVDQPVNVGRHVVFKRFLGIFLSKENGRKRSVFDGNFCESNLLKS